MASRFQESQGEGRRGPARILYDVHHLRHRRRVLLSADGIQLRHDGVVGCCALGDLLRPVLVWREEPAALGVAPVRVRKNREGAFVRSFQLVFIIMYL